MKNFEWKDYTDAIYINYFLFFYAGMTGLRTTPYIFKENYWKNQTLKTIVISNILLFSMVIISSLPNLSTKHFYPENDTIALVGRVGSAILLSIFLVLFLPRINKAHKKTLTYDII